MELLKNKNAVKRVVTLLTVVVILFVLVSCGKEQEQEQKYKYKSTGKTNTEKSNLANDFGDQQGNLVYTLDIKNDVEGSMLVRFEAKGDPEKKEVLKTFNVGKGPVDISVIGNWIYCSVPEEGLYRVSLDGNKTEQISKENICGMYIKDKMIYYTTVDIDGDSTYIYRPEIYSMQLDGSDNKCIVKKKGDETIILGIVDDRLFYNNINFNEPNVNERETLYSADLNGNNKKVLGKFKTMGNIAKYNGWVYFIEAKDQWIIHKMKVDGSQDKEIRKVQLNKKGSIFIGEKKGKIYYQIIHEDKKGYTEKSELYKMNSEGKEVEKISEDKAWDILLLEDYILLFEEVDDHSEISFKKVPY